MQPAISTWESRVLSPCPAPLGRSLASFRGPGGCFLVHLPNSEPSSDVETWGQSRELLIGVMSSQHLRKLLGEHLPKMFYFSFFPLEKRSV